MDIYEANFSGARVSDKNSPEFTYTIAIQYVDCKVDKTGKVKEGSDDSILETTYRIALSKNDEPDIEKVGHYWEIIQFEKVGDVKRIIWMNITHTNK